MEEKKYCKSKGCLNLAKDGSLICAVCLSHKIMDGLNKVEAARKERERKQRLDAMCTCCPVHGKRKIGG